MAFLRTALGLMCVLLGAASANSLIAADRPSERSAKAAQEIEWLPVQDLVADPAAVTLLLIPESEDGTDREAAPARKQDVRLVIVRGVFPAKKQFEAVADALRLSKTSPLRRDFDALVDLSDFELQRQEVTGASDQEERPWRTVSLQKSQDLLIEAQDFVPDPVAEEFIHMVITSPLPSLAGGEWDRRLVSHPKLPKVPEVQPAAPSRLEEKPTASASRPKSDADLFELFGRPGEAGPARKVRPAPEYVLFRFLDPEAPPGVSVRYRVRLKVQKPNIDPAGERVAEHYQGEHLWMPWSKPSDPVAVPKPGE